MVIFFNQRKIRVKNKSLIFPYLSFETKKKLGVGGLSEKQRQTDSYLSRPRQTKTETYKQTDRLADYQTRVVRTYFSLGLNIYCQLPSHKRTEFGDAIASHYLGYLRESQFAIVRCR